MEATSKIIPPISELSSDINAMVKIITNLQNRKGKYFRGFFL